MKLLALLLVACVPAPSLGPWRDRVYACEVENASDMHAIVDLELCYDRGPDELEQQLWNRYGGMATCQPTRRHAGICQYCCRESCGPGANAFDGSFCP